MKLDKLKKKICKEIIKTGFPLELYCKREILHLGFGLTSSKYYTDSEGRYEIDAEATMQSRITKDTTLFSSLIIECKKNKSKPWVFFSDQDYVQPLVFSKMKKLRIYLFKNFYEQCQDHHFNPNNTTNISENFFVPFTTANNKESRQIYEGISNLIRHVKNERKHINRLTKGSKLKCVDTYYLNIVFDGLLFLAKVKNEKINLNKTNHVVVKITELEPNMPYSHYVFDIVTKSYFKKYLSILKKDHEVMRKFIVKYKRMC